MIDGRTSSKVPTARYIDALGELGTLSTGVVIAAVLTGALVLQYGYAELPCPLCMLQRIAMLGICFGIIRHFQPDDGMRGLGIALLSALFLLLVAVRQVLIDIYPRPGHNWVGSAVFGLHLPTWSVVVALCTMIALSIRIAVGASRTRPAPYLIRIWRWFGRYVVLLCTINLVSAFAQCGIGACHTDGYWILQAMNGRV